MSSPAYPVVKGTLTSTENHTWNTADLLGRGASAIVYLGRHKNGQVVAVKVFHDYVNQCCDPEDLRELELLRRLNHPNIIKLLAIERVQHSTRNVLIMEYCEGGSLHHMLDQPPYYYGLPEHEFLLVLQHVSGGMDYLRREKVIHRDIKPGNIMRYISKDGDSIYKLTDFGAARNLEEEEKFQSLYGTEEYLHPGIYERAVLKLPTAQSFDSKVDLWSLGVTFYHTATGQLPFQPYGGRSNRHTMFEIITQKQTGVISGIQTVQNGPIRWQSELPDTSQLSSGLKSKITPLLAGLMEPDSAKMITYDSFFRMVRNIKEKITINVFHYSRCEDVCVYADASTTYSVLQDEVGQLTDIPACDQILLVGGKLLEEVVDPMLPLNQYPHQLLKGSIYLFQREMNEVGRLRREEIPSTPEFVSTVDMDGDARLAHTCAARGELYKRLVETVCDQQQRLMDGLLCLRMHVESRLAATKDTLDLMRQLMEECNAHFDTFFSLVAVLRNVIAANNSSSTDVGMLDHILQDTVIRQVNTKAQDRIREIETYPNVLVKKLEDIKAYTGKYSPVCVQEKCAAKLQHHMNIISSVQSRFRRDKSVKRQMTGHDEKIHGFEKERLKDHCATMRLILTEHCLPHLDRLFKSCIHISESLTKCLTRVAKIEKNISSVVSCQKLLSDRLKKLKTSCCQQLMCMKDSGFMSERMHSQASNSDKATGELTEGNTDAANNSLDSGDNLLEPEGSYNLQAVSEQGRKLEQELKHLKLILDENTESFGMLLQRLDDASMQSSGSLARATSNMQRLDPSMNTFTNFT